MFFVSQPFTTSPASFSTTLQEQTYETLNTLHIPFERVETDEAITMADCVLINQQLEMDMVKTLFLCNRQKIDFYLFITKGDKPFRSKDFSNVLKIARESFAPEELMEKKMLGTKIGAATGYMKVKTKQIMEEFLPFTHHEATIIEV